TDPGTPGNPMGNISPNCVASSVSCSTTSPTSSPTTLTAPTVTTQTVVKYEVHVSKNGTNAFSPIVSVTINPPGAASVRIDPLALEFSNAAQAVQPAAAQSSRQAGTEGAVASVEADASLGGSAFERATRNVHPGGRLSVTGLVLEADTGISALELRRFEV